MLALQVPYDDRWLDDAHQLGLEAIQLRLGEGFPLWGPGGFDGDAHRVADDLKRRGLKVIALGYYRNMLASDPAERRREIAGLLQVMPLAEIFETDLIGVFAGRDPELSIRDNLPAFAEVWQPLAEEAAELGLRFAFENCTMFKGYPVRGINLCHTPYAFERMFEAVPSPNLGIEFDPSHLHKQHIDSTAFVRRFGERIFHVHSKDHEHLPAELELHGSFDPRVSRDRLPGDGEIDFAAVFEALAETGYRGDVTLEVERQAMPEDASQRLPAMMRAVEYLRNLGEP